MKAGKSLLIKKIRLLIVKKEKKKKVISMITQIRTNKSFINLICVDKKLKKKKKKKAKLFLPSSIIFT